MVLKEEEKIKCKPFLRWAGGKNWFIKHLKDYLPTSFNNYHEPFIGGGSVLLNIQPENAFVSDFNKELIDTYKAIKKDVLKVISYLEKFKNTEEFYYYIREKEYPNNFYKSAARFIYLNQTSFNGIYRVNLKGKYNVPFGYRSKEFLDVKNLIAVSKAIQNYEFIHCDFFETIKNINEGDLVFLDPPYTITHNDNGFIKYNSKLFEESSQLRLSEYIDLIKEKGAFYILTNAAHDWVKQTFKRKDDKIEPLERASLIGGKNAKRGNYKEFIFTNVTIG